jgi:protein involved in polysaccharide export with SLBB domain
VLASAGGLTTSANTRKIVLMRDGRAQPLQITTDAAPLPIALRSGDQIVVGPKGWMRENLPILVGAGASVLAAIATSLIIR